MPPGVTEVQPGRERTVRPKRGGRGGRGAPRGQVVPVRQRRTTPGRRPTTTRGRVLPGRRPQTSTQPRAAWDTSGGPKRMRAQFEIPDALRWAGLDAALAGLQGLAELDLSMGGIPLLYESGVVYEREPRGTERWLSPSVVLSEGAADCEDLAAWRAAELTVTGADPDAIAQVVRTGPRTWHAVVQRGDGTYEDPSAALGMMAAGGLMAPLRFILDPLDSRSRSRDYRARLELNGLGNTEIYEADGHCPACALGETLEQASTMGELGITQMISPLLSMFSSMLSPSSSRPAPGTVVPMRSQAQAPTVQVPQQPGAAPVVSYPQLYPPAGTQDLESSLIDLARELRKLVEREASRTRRRRRR